MLTTPTAASEATLRQEWTDAHLPPKSELGEELYQHSASAARSRVRALLGDDVMDALHGIHVLIVGAGAVGGAAIESLARSGIGEMTIIDGDTFELSNLNRQPFARYSTLGKPKASTTAALLADIAPDLRIHAHDTFLTPDNIHTFLPLARQSEAKTAQIPVQSQRLKPSTATPKSELGEELCQHSVSKARPISHIIDACDDLAAKVTLICAAHRLGLPIWSAMGAARKLDPSAFRVTDLSKTQVCPLARNLRRALREHQITRGVRCVWSTELPTPWHDEAERRRPNSQLPTPNFQVRAWRGAMSTLCERSSPPLASYMPATATAGHLLAADLLQSLIPSVTADFK